MEIASRLSRACLAAAVLAAAAAAHAGVLYKSIDPQGRVTFSDMPIDGAVVSERIVSPESAKPSGDGAPVYLALAEGMDAAVAQANARVDLAEHALALARRSLIEDGALGFPASRLSRADSQLVEFYKRDVAAARRNLMRVLQQRMFAPQRPLA